MSHSEACSWTLLSHCCRICDQLLAEAEHKLTYKHIRAIAITAGKGMIDVIIADHQEVFRIGVVEVLGAEEDIRIVGKPECPKQLLNMLTTVNPHILILSRSFLPAFSKIKRMLKRCRSPLLVLTEEDDPVGYLLRLLSARGILYCSKDGSDMVDAVRRVARAEPLAQNLSSDHARKSPNQSAG